MRFTGNRLATVQKMWLGAGLLTDLMGLAICVIAVHVLYVFWLDPAAASALALAEGAAPPRTLAVMLKDPEQEVCLMLGFWCLWLLVFRHRLLDDDAHILRIDPLGLAEIDLSDWEQVSWRIDDAARSVPNALPLEAAKAAMTALMTSKSFHDANAAASDACERRLEALYARLSIVRYVLWAIPSVGFLGTVRGIGEALGKADAALAGDLGGMAASLGVAFNSTFIALFVSLILTLAAQALQGRDERQAADARRFVAEDLLAPMSAARS